MGLTENQMQLIKAVAQNDIKAAKKCSLNCLLEDTTAKNRYFCSRNKAILESTASNLIELPQDLKGIICVEDVSNSFKEARYYLSDREKNLYDSIKRMKSVNQRLMEIGIPYINSTLLYGESGTGKTTFGRYVAYKAGLPFCYLNFTTLVDSYMGATSRNISKAFSYAISNPCVLMLDEIDCISIRRSDSSSSGGSDGEMARITITLMQEFDKLPNDIIVIGATNRMDRIDEALLSRFSLKHEVKTFSVDENTEMVKQYIADIDFEFLSEEVFDLVRIPEHDQRTIIKNLIQLIAVKILNEQTTGGSS